MLAVLVAKDGAAWIKRCLSSLARQSYPRLGVLAVDNGSVDGSGGLLEDLLGPRRVLRLRRDVGFAGAVRRALATDAAAEADYVLLLHDDTALAKGAVAAMVRAARADGVGIVGPKVRDGESTRVLREIGFTADRFGYRYSPLEEGEIDQGQHDSTREVLFVSSAAMLVSREAWRRAGAPDERLRPAHADLDFCWGVRLAGFRVVMEPGAVAFHLAAGDRGLRRNARRLDGRYLDERSQLVAVLKNTRLITLLWVLPLYLLQGVAKMLLFLLGRRFGDAAQVARAWGWGLLRFPGTLARRVRRTAVRVTKEREISELLAPLSSSYRRWAGELSSALFPARDEERTPEEVAAVPLRERVGGILGRHPGRFAFGIGLVLTILAFRNVLFASPLEGGALPAFPGRAIDLLRGYAAGVTPGGLGGPDGASPALVPLGVASFVTLGSPQILAWIVVAFAPLAAGIAAFRAALRRTGNGAAAVGAAASYALSAVVLWAVSEGRIAEIVFLVGLPWVLSRIAQPFETGVQRPFRWVLATAIGLAITGSFFPSIWLSIGIGVVLLVPTGFRGRRLAGLGHAVATLALSAVLAFPFVLTLVRIGVGTGELGLTTRIGDLLRLAPGEAPGAWAVALFLPVAGTLGLALAEDRRAAWRAAGGAVVGLPLAWLASAGHLPGLMTDPVAYLGLAAFGLSLLVALGIAAMSPEGRTSAFGARQVVFGLLVVVVVGGTFLQGLRVIKADWGVGEDRAAPAYPVVQTFAPRVPFRVLWLGRVGGGSFPAPGGPPEGVVEARAASVRYGVTGRNGRSALAIGLPAAGPGYERLELALRAMLAGRVRHGGSLLAPFGIAFVVAGPDDLPPAALDRLGAQLDLVQGAESGGIRLYRNASLLPLAAVLPSADPQSLRSGEVLASARVDRSEAIPLRREGAVGWAGTASLGSAGTAVVSTEYRPDWVLRVNGEERRPFPAFGWAVGYEVPAGSGSLHVVFERRWLRLLEIGILAVVWIAALWTIRRRRT